MKALIIIDVQNDFCPGGALAVPGGDEVVPVINQLTTVFDRVIVTQDWHPEGHLSFASSHAGKVPLQTVTLPYGEQVLWPDHCIQDSNGADFHPDLDLTKAELIVQKGFRKEIDSYSAFYENDQKTDTGLADYLKDQGIETLYMTGLALDFCVAWSAIDGQKAGFDVKVIGDATRGIDANGSLESAMWDMKEAGVEMVVSNQILGAGL